ncbi:hypothetical protein [Roseibium album]|uniref:hypothetical protein n=1 Tax=Roseibium album TaxID=311410 RepID=UPI0011875ED2|nr:hypothetical protein [Roseibium album]
MHEFVALCVNNGNNSEEVLSFAKANSLNKSDEHKTKQTYFVRLFTQDGLEFHYREVEFTDMRLVDCSTNFLPFGGQNTGPKTLGDPPLHCSNLAESLLAILPDSSRVDLQNTTGVRVLLELPQQRAHIVGSQSIEGAFSNFSVQKIIFKEGS